MSAHTRSHPLLQAFPRLDPPLAFLRPREGPAPARGGRGARTRMPRLTRAAELRAAAAERKGVRGEARGGTPGRGAGKKAGQGRQGSAKGVDAASGSAEQVAAGPSSAGADGAEGEEDEFVDASAGDREQGDYCCELDYDEHAAFGSDLIDDGASVAGNEDADSGREEGVGAMRQSWTSSTASSASDPHARAPSRYSSVHVVAQDPGRGADGRSSGRIGSPSAVAGTVGGHPLFQAQLSRASTSSSLRSSRSDGMRTPTPLGYSAGPVQRFSHPGHAASQDSAYGYHQPPAPYSHPIASYSYGAPPLAPNPFPATPDRRPPPLPHAPTSSLHLSLMPPRPAFRSVGLGFAHTGTSSPTLLPVRYREPWQLAYSLSAAPVRSEVLGERGVPSVPSVTVVPVSPGRPGRREPAEGARSDGGRKGAAAGEKPPPQPAAPAALPPPPPAVSAAAGAGQGQAVQGWPFGIVLAAGPDGGLALKLGGPAVQGAIPPVAGPVEMERAPTARQEEADAGEAADGTARAAGTGGRRRPGKRELNADIRLGGLGPDLESDEYRRKAELAKAKAEYAERTRVRNLLKAAKAGLQRGTGGGAGGA